MKDKLEPASPEERRRVYERLWLELTIIGRIVWIESGLPVEAKLKRLGWLNEIQHRVWGAHQRPVECSPDDLESTILSHASEVEGLKPLVTQAMKRSLKVLG